jgi:hypothetical protein
MIYEAREVYNKICILDIKLDKLDIKKYYLIFINTTILIEILKYFNSHLSLCFW